MKNEVRTLKNMKCRTEISRPIADKVVNSTLMLKLRHDHTGHKAEYKANLVACGTEETADDEESFSLVPSL